MTEDKKEEKVEEKNEVTPEIKKEAVKAETKGLPAAAAQVAPQPEKKEAPPVKKEKPANCAACKKSIRKKRWYYRDGKFYCTKRCWQTTLKKDAAAAEAGQENKQSS